MKKMLKNLFKKLLAMFMARSNLYILQRMRHKDIISFDIFDTLVCRDVDIPEKIFDFIGVKCENKFGISRDQYVAKRISAEYSARSVCLSEDVTLSDIYEYFFLDADDKQCLMNMEMDTEYEHCYRKERGYELYNKAISEGKKVILTSDMYLNRQIIIAILKKCGYENFSNLYLSSEIGFKKKTGNLFRYILKDLNIEGDKLLHIGDNPISDGISAIICGITCAIIK